MNPSPTRSRRASVRGRLLLLATLAMVLSGCTMRALIGVDVEEDGSGTFQMSMAFDEEMQALLEQDATEPIDWTDPASFEGEDSPAALLDEMPEGATIEPYTEDGFEGFTVSVDFESLDELNAVLAESASEGEETLPFRITTDGDGRFELVSEGELFESAELSEEETEFLPPEALADLFDIQLHVNLPGEVVSTNADEITDDGTMIWRINPMAEESVVPAASSEASGASGSGLLFLIGGTVVVGAAAAAVLLRRRNDDTDAAEEVVEPAEEPIG